MDVAMVQAVVESR